MFSIQSYTVDPTQLVYSCRWAYTNEDGHVAGTHKLAVPEEDYSVLPLEDVTEEVLLGWLTDQIVNTPEEFEAQIAKNKMYREEQEALTTVVLN